MTDPLVALRSFVAEVVREVVREELRRTPGADDYLTVQEAAAIARVGQGTVRAWLRDGRLRRFGETRPLVRRGDLEAFLEEPRRRVRAGAVDPRAAIAERVRRSRG